MKSNISKSQENKAQSSTKAAANKSNDAGANPVSDARPEAVVQQKLQNIADNYVANQPAIQKKANNTGLPDSLKSGVEDLSGMAMDDVKVHYNSDKPADLQAHAYAQGNDIHLGPGQEKHLPHEAWHVVQQAQGRVKPTLQMKGVKVNDDAGLEKEADAMGSKAAASGKSKADKDLPAMRKSWSSTHFPAQLIAITTQLAPDPKSLSKKEAKGGAAKATAKGKATSKAKDL